MIDRLERPGNAWKWFVLKLCLALAGHAGYLPQAEIIRYVLLSHIQFGVSGERLGILSAKLGTPLRSSFFLEL